MFEKYSDIFRLDYFVSSAVCPTSFAIKFVMYKVDLTEKCTFVNQQMLKSGLLKSRVCDPERSVGSRVQGTTRFRTIVRNDRF